MSNSKCLFACRCYSEEALPFKSIVSKSFYQPHQDDRLKRFQTNHPSTQMLNSVFNHTFSLFAQNVTYYKNVVLKKQTNHTT